MIPTILRHAYAPPPNDSIGGPGYEELDSARIKAPPKKGRRITAVSNIHAHWLYVCLLSLHPSFIKDFHLASINHQHNSGEQRRLAMEGDPTEMQLAPEQKNISGSVGVKMGPIICGNVDGRLMPVLSSSSNTIRQSKLPSHSSLSQPGSFFTTVGALAWPSSLSAQQTRRSCWSLCCSVLTVVGEVLLNLCWSLDQRVYRLEMRLSFYDNSYPHLTWCR